MRSIRLRPALTTAIAGLVLTLLPAAHPPGADARTWERPSDGADRLVNWESTGTPTIVVGGEPTYGTTLVADAGDGWVPTPDRYTYQWKRNGQVMLIATRSSYTIRGDEVGDEISVVVSGVKSGYPTVPVESASVTVVAGTLTGVTPTITGTPRVGERLWGEAGDWQPIGTALTYRWFAGPSLVKDHSTSLEVTASMVGQPILLRVTGTRDGYTPLTTESAPTVAVTPGKVRAGTPTVLGVLRVGNTAYAASGSWGPGDVRLSYRWKVGGKVVSGRRGAGRAFVIPRGALGKRLSVTVSGRLAGYVPATRTSAPSDKVRPNG